MASKPVLVAWENLTVVHVRLPLPCTSPMSDVPQQRDAVTGNLGGRGEGVVGVMSGGNTIAIFPGALLALQVSSAEPAHTFGNGCFVSIIPTHTPKAESAHS